MKQRNNWTQKRIGEVCLVGDGTHAKIKRQDNGILYLTAKNIKPGRLKLSKVDCISEADFERYFCKSTQSIRKPEAGDILFGIIGSIGEPYLVKPEDLFGISSSLAILRPNQTIIWSPYLYYWVKGPIFQNTLQASKAGVVQCYISLNALKGMPIAYPDLGRQQKIAAILTDYDDLISNNQRRIKLLEQMAQSIYYEWFVKWQIPNPNLEWREATPEQQQVTGQELFPVGWAIAPIGEAIETISGDTPAKKKPEYWANGTLVWYRTTDLTTAGTMFVSDSTHKITEVGRQHSKIRTFPPYSVMMTSRATIGVVALNTTTACTNQGFITCIPNDRLSAYYLYFWIKENRDRIFNLASGLMYREINLGWFRQLPIAIPDSATHRQFIETLDPLCRQIETLQAKTTNLKLTRELLLSKLLSGEIDVE
ncbi:restriction endonuclease subunit S [Phormidium pseudopriestleyi FRX01]|uniref:Restriction endonuclease subunit S n=1 Tax=Phormidium pseudopriestleyi FRX01 TaxID=1759528 RepID=A0ABS3FYR3_9CYAN|nr:restriction endonuclease subunit S [Phormidium pseudopriestleyi FRX01]